VELVGEFVVNFMSTSNDGINHEILPVQCPFGLHFQECKRKFVSCLDGKVNQKWPKKLLSHLFRASTSTM
jgi:hypothetical protein